MYVVLSKQNCSDATFPQLVILGLTDNPSAALSLARSAIRGEYKLFIDNVTIYNIEINKAYSHNDFKNAPLMYMTYHQLESEITEVLFDAFKIYKRKRVGIMDTNAEKAQPNMYRALVMFDSDELWHIYEDVPTREEAYQLCLWAAKNTYLFQVFNDQGEPEVINGKLK